MTWGEFKAEVERQIRAQRSPRAPDSLEGIVVDYIDVCTDLAETIAVERSVGSIHRLPIGSITIRSN